MTTLTDLYRIATSDEYGVARHPLPCGGELLCCIDRVAGRSIIRKHTRTTYRLVKAGEKYSKQISHRAATALIGCEAAS